MNHHTLQLDRAQALLRQAGLPLPEGQPDDDAYLQSLLDRLCDLSAHDPLTGLLNRRSLVAVLEQELDRVARTGDPALLLMVDIDHFKPINDTHGHLVGDQAIVAVAQALRACVRPMDSVARYGGEEFALVFPNCPPSFAQQVGERIRSRVAAQPVAVSSGALSLTVSCGGAYALPWLPGTALAWLERADAQMYRAKVAGRNRVCLEAQVRADVSAEEKGLLFGLGQSDGLIIGTVPDA